MSQQHDDTTFEIDHVTPEKLHGPTILDNLALACFACNNHKGPNIAGIDPETTSRTFLFNPRTDQWDEHFTWQHENVGQLVGRTPEGRATIDLLQLNAAHRLAHRAHLIREGIFLLR